MRDDLLAPAEEPGLWTPHGPGTVVLRGSGAVVVGRSGRGTVEGLRLPEGGVAEAVASLRAIARRGGIRELVWWVGELSRPPGVAAELEALGMVPFAEEPLLTTLTTDREPPEVDGVRVRPVTDLAGYRRALELDWDAWGVPVGDRGPGRRTAAADWEALVASGRVVHHVAEVDGRPAGFSRLVMTESAGVLMGGAVLPSARGRGAYRALVRARWREAAARGVPRLVTSAGAMSRPILERLGWEAIGRVRLLLDPGL